MCPEGKTEDGFDMQLGTNHFGHFAFTELVMPLIRKSSASGHHPRYSCNKLTKARIQIFRQN